MKLSGRSLLATFAIVATWAMSAFAYMAAQSLDRLAHSNDAAEIMSTRTQDRVRI